MSYMNCFDADVSEYELHDGCSIDVVGSVDFSFLIDDNVNVRQKN